MPTIELLDQVMTCNRGLITVLCCSFSQGGCTEAELCRHIAEVCFVNSMSDVR